MGPRNKIPYAITNFESIRTENHDDLEKQLYEITNTIFLFPNSKIRKVLRIFTCAVDHVIFYFVTIQGPAVLKYRVYPFISYPLRFFRVL